MDKTEWATTVLTFLGLLIDTGRQMVFIPAEKVERARHLIAELMLVRTTTVKQIQRLCGILNFFSRCIIPARVFTRRLYAMIRNIADHPRYHIRITNDVRADLIMWQSFLADQSAFCRPFADFSKVLTAEDINMYTDSSTNPELGCGGYCDREWFLLKWDADFIREQTPSINYLELFAVTVAVLKWIYKYPNTRVALFCDNQSVVDMINRTTSSCRNCMVLLRIIVLQGLVQNVRITAKHVPGKLNQISDSLSRQKMNLFRQLTAELDFEPEPVEIPSEIWPLSKIWIY